MIALYIVLALAFLNLDYRNKTSCVIFIISLICTTIGVVGTSYVDYIAKNEVQIKVIKSMDDLIKSNYSLGDNK